MKINNDIEQPLCKFEISKLLKENGFDMDSDSGWILLGERYHWNNRLFTYDIYQPTQSTVLHWLKANFGIWILVLPQVQTMIDYRTDGYEFPHHAFFYTIIRYDKDGNCTEPVNTSDNNSADFLHFETEEDAYNHAFKKILTTLI
jgi:hypothetical protein